MTTQPRAGWGKGKDNRIHGLGRVWPAVRGVGGDQGTPGTRGLLRYVLPRPVAAIRALLSWFSFQGAEVRVRTLRPVDLLRWEDAYEGWAPAICGRRHGAYGPRTRSDEGLHLSVEPTERPCLGALVRRCQMGSCCKSIAASRQLGRCTFCNPPLGSPFAHPPSLLSPG